MRSSLWRNLLQQGWLPGIIVASMALCLASSALHSAEPPSSDVFPGKSWEIVAQPEKLGWSQEKLDAAWAYADSIHSAGVFLVHRGKVVAQWGQTEKRYNVHSIRKSFFSALAGIYVAEGKIRMTDSLEKLGIDDNEPRPTAIEKQATVADLFKARSGVYHPALYETEGMKKRRPLRGSHPPSAFWYYNNWDFNVLGTIFEKCTGEGIFKAFQRRIAEPLEMEDFRLQDTQYVRGADSDHPAYPFRMTARDMARFGLMFARGGRWRDKQVIPRDWVVESTTSYSPATNEQGNVYCGYGYLWWTELFGRHVDHVELPKGSFSARGAGGHYIVVVPAWDMVIVHRVDTDEETNPKVDRNQFGNLVKRIVEAMPAAERNAPPVPKWGANSLASALDELVPRLMAKHKVPGVAIVGLKNRRIDWERYYGVRRAGESDAVDAQTLFEACSMSKTPAAYFALKLVEEKKLDLDRPLHEYLDKPYLPDEPRHLKITARMALTHTTGFPNWRAGGWRSGNSIKMISEPGAKFTYSGEGILFLQRVIEKITGQPFEQYAQKTLFEPLGIALSSYEWQDAYEKLAAAGHDDRGEAKPDRPLYREANAAFSLYCTPIEYAIFIQEILAPDRSRPQSISASMRESMLTRAVEAAGRKPILRGGKRSSQPAYYGLGWAIDVAESGDRIYHGGSNGSGFRCYCEFDPKTGAGIVIMTNAVNGDKLWGEVMAAVGTP
ncbi:MAG: serine hydrolase [Pirellulales bacterium]|nr:serine hydrolase [Pirellulales bacterium]